MKEQTIGFIGGGNMASSLVGGLIADGFTPKNIWVSDVDAEKLAELHSRWRVNTSTDNTQVAAVARVLVLAVKPQILHTVAMDIAEMVKQHRPLAISIAAGIREKDIERWLGGSTAIVRCMPNTPALVRTGATALHANARVSDEQHDWAESILRAVGLTVWVNDESMLDVVTALSGSGPAYLFLFMEAMEQAALGLGLDPQTAQVLTEQTVFGAAKVALEVDEPPDELRRRVTSPGGTTQKAIEVFEQGGLRALVAQAMSAAHTRSIELSNELGSR
jgi:pyrroline-5-carboxylate reductase